MAAKVAAPSRRWCVPRIIEKGLAEVELEAFHHHHCRRHHRLLHRKRLRSYCDIYLGSAEASARQTRAYLESVTEELTEFLTILLMSVAVLGTGGLLFRPKGTRVSICLTCSRLY